MSSRPTAHARHRVLLVGPRGTGKSAVGALLAPRLGVPFLDADDLVERESGRSIRDLMAAGEFRSLEVSILKRLLDGPPAVIAAGGGAVLWPGLASAAEAAQPWRVVWLDADPRILARRIAADRRDRPSLTGLDPASEIQRVAADRRPLYEAIAWKRVDTGADDLETVAARIDGLLTGRKKARPDLAD